MLISLFGRKKNKLDDWKTMMQYVKKGNFMFSFDLKSGYHHIDLFVGHQQYTGFSFIMEGRVRYFFFTVLCFGLTTGPFIFTKLLRPLVRHWRGQGIKIALFLDDGAGTNTNYDSCFSHAQLVKADLESAGFVINREKSIWTPCQGLVWLGLYWNLMKGVLEIPESRLLKVETSIFTIFNRLYGVSARKLAKLAGLIISLFPSLGPITQLMTRHMYFVINSRNNWDSPLDISHCTELLQELCYWKSQVRYLNGGCKFHSKSRIYPLKIYSDSSSVASAAFVQNMHQMVCHQMFSDIEKSQSSTYRELMAVDLALNSFGKELQNQEIQVCSDSQNVVRILQKGSRKDYLHKMALSVFSACLRYNIHLNLVWIPRSENERADFLSRMVDTGDWRISDCFFEFVNSLWGPSTIDRFANLKNTKLPRFNSKYWNPGAEAVDAFT